MAEPSWVRTLVTQPRGTIRKFSGAVQNRVGEGAKITADTLEDFGPALDEILEFRNLRQ